MGCRLFFTCMVLTSFLMINFSSLNCQAQLSSNFYDSTCPNALSTIKTVIDAAVASETRMAASLIRLHFHDCFVQGCDGSVLLADTATFTGERTAPQNQFSIRGFNVIDDAKTQVESICPGVVSCADILAVAARDSSVAVNGPTWTVKLGRRDSTTASLALATSDLPRFSDSLSTILNLFSDKGLNARETVVLSGAHTIGQAACATFRDRIYGNDSIDPDFATTRQSNCPQSGGNGNLAPLDEVTPNAFDTNYFSNILAQRGLLASDQVLFSNGASTANIVTEYSNNPTTFNDDFAAAMVKMGDINPLTGTQGEIRTVCTAVN